MCIRDSYGILLSSWRTCMPIKIDLNRLSIAQGLSDRPNHMIREFKKWRQQRQRQRHKWMIWLVEWEKNNRATRAARFLVQCFDVVCQMTTWRFHIWGSDDHASSQLKIFHSLPLHENHSYQVSESAARLFCTTWSTWNNRKRLDLTQSSI